MHARRFQATPTIRTFTSSGAPHDYVAGSKPVIVGDGEIHAVHIPGSQFQFHGGFKIEQMEIEVDETNTICQFNAVIDIYYVPPSYVVSENDPLKLGTVNYWGKLVTVSGSKKPKWNTQIVPTLLYAPSDSVDLPDLVLQVGLGAFVTAIVQSLFGTKDGIKLLGLESYNIPDADVGSNEIR